MWLGCLRATFTREHHDCNYRKHKTVGLPSLRQNVATKRRKLPQSIGGILNLRTERRSFACFGNPYCQLPELFWD